MTFAPLFDALPDSLTRGVARLSLISWERYIVVVTASDGIETSVIPLPNHHPWKWPPKLLCVLRWTGVLLGYLCLILAVFHQVWLPDAGHRRVLGWDCTRAYWQDLVFVMNAFADGELPLWNPFMAMGYSFYSEPQTGLYSPLNWLLYAVGVLSGSRDSWLIQAKVLLTFWLGLVGMHVWVHRRSRSHVVAVFAAVSFGLGSPLLVFKSSALAWPILYLPWALLALERFVARPTRRTAALFAAAIWLTGSAGSPQSFFMCALVICSYAVFLAWRGVDAPSPWSVAEGSPSPSVAAPMVEREKGIARRLGARLRTGARALRAVIPWVAFVVLLASLLLAPVYVPAWQAMPYTPRASRSLEFLLAQPQTWASMGELFLAHRDRNWFLDLYLGGLVIPLAGFALVTVTRRNAARCLFWLSLTTFGVLLSLGEHTPVLPWLIRHVPGFDLFRIPYRYKLFFVVGLVFLSAEGCAALIVGRLALWQRLAWIALAAAWVVHAARSSSGLPDPGVPLGISAARDHLTWLTPAFVLLALPSWMRACSGAGRRFGPRLVQWAWAPGLVAVVLVVADLWSAGKEKLLIMERPPRQEHDGRLYAQWPGLARREYRLYQQPTHLSAMNHGVRELGGYTTFPMRVTRFDDVIRAGRFDWALLGRFNVRWIHAAVPRHYARRLPTFALRRAWNLLEVREPAPLLELFPGYEVVPSGQALSRMRRPGRQRCALVEPDEAHALRRALGPPGKGCNPHAGPALAHDVESPNAAGRLLTYSRNRLVFELSSGTGGVAVINEPYFPGWTATVDGHPAALLRANHLLRAVPVPAGTHRLELVYRPRTLPWLGAGFLLGLLLLAVTGTGLEPMLVGVGKRVWRHARERVRGS